MRKRKSSSGGTRSVRWTLMLFAVTFAVSSGISFLSEEALRGSGLLGAFCILMVIVFVGILFDILGVAAAAADEQPFHAMASRKVSGAREALFLLRHAEQVSSVCNDVVGDICGVISGSASAVIAARAAALLPPGRERTVSLLMSALVAALTVGGKSAGKALAMRSSTRIVHLAGRVLNTFGLPPRVGK